MKPGRPLRRRSPLRRGGPLRRRRKKRPPEGPLTQIEWMAAVYRRAGGRSDVSGVRLPAQWLGPANFHHVISKQALRQAGLYDQVWRWENGMLLTWEEHADHESGHRRIPREKVPRVCRVFAAELGPRWESVIESPRYPTEGGSP